MRDALLAFVRRLTVAAFIATLPPAASAAAAQPSTEPIVSDLAPGRYIWRDDGTATGPVTIVVSLPLQLAYVFRRGTLVGASSVSSGAPGYDTPTETFTILQKDKDHRSNVYDDAPMPYMLRLTWDGVALHAGKVTGEPASHGCIRLPAAFARKLFEIASLGASVTVLDEVPAFLQQANTDAGDGPVTETASR